MDHEFLGNPPRKWNFVKCALVAPAGLALLVVLFFGIRYFSLKQRLDRVLPVRGSKVFLSFEPALPDWIRGWVGEDWCEPLYPIVEIAFRCVTDDDIAKWRGNFEPKSIVIGYVPPDYDDAPSDVTDRGLALMGDVRSLERLSVRCGRYSSQGLSALSRCPNLTSLELSNAELTSDWYEGVKKCRKLSRLEVAKRSELVVADVEAVAAMDGLREVRLTGTNRTVDPTEPLDEVLKGCRWSISVGNLTRAILEPLASVKLVDTLVINCETMDTDALSPLAHLSSLKQLQIACNQFPCDFMRGMPECHSIESLTISYMDSSEDHGLKHLTSLRSLRQLMLHLGNLTLDDMKAISQLTSLRSLRIAVQRPEVEGLDLLGSLVDLEELDLESVEGFDRTLSVLQFMPRLHWLRFYSEQTEPLQEIMHHSRLPAGLAIAANASMQVPKFRGNIAIGDRTLLPPDPPQALCYGCYLY